MWARCLVIFLFGLFSSLGPATAAQVVPLDTVVSGVVVRQQPTTNSAIVGALHPGGSSTYLGDQPGWYRVRLPNGDEGFVSKRWTQTTHSQKESSQCYVVGTWNLEYFKFGHKRGFPEHPGLPARTEAQIDKLVFVIKTTLDAKLLILNEINGLNATATSVELDDLVHRLGPNWKYIIDKSGRAQRIAMIWNSNFVRKIAHEELAIERTNVEGGDIFFRNPLVGHFQFISTGHPENDFTIVGIHLASGTHKTANHDAAMATLGAKINAIRGHDVLPAGEHDVIIGGDFNASPYDSHDEQFFRNYNRGAWKLLADGPDYPATRISGKQIDFLIVSRWSAQQDGLFGDEIGNSSAKVWNVLAADDLERYRLDLSDHFPVTTCIAVTSDKD